MIDNFSDQHAFLSSFHRRPITYEGILYPGNEWGFAAAKTLDQAMRLKIAAAPTASKAKALGRQVKLIPGWDQYWRYVVMERLIGLKFLPDEEMAPLLLGTENEPLVEGNTWHDNVWGDCRCGVGKCAATGMNLLGWMLMRQRSLLRTGVLMSA